MSCRKPPVASEYLDIQDKRRIYALHMRKLTTMKSSLDTQPKKPLQRIIAMQNRRKARINMIKEIDAENASLIKNYQENRKRNVRTCSHPKRTDWMKELENENNVLAPMTQHTASEEKSKETSTLFNDDGFVVADEHRATSKPATSASVRHPSGTKITKPNHETQQKKHYPQKTFETKKIPDLLPAKEEEQKEAEAEESHNDEKKPVVDTTIGSVIKDTFNDEKKQEETEKALENDEDDKETTIGNVISDTLNKEKEPEAEEKEEEKPEEDKKDTTIGGVITDALNDEKQDTAIPDAITDEKKPEEEEKEKENSFSIGGIINSIKKEEEQKEELTHDEPNEEVKERSLPEQANNDDTNDAFNLDEPEIDEQPKANADEQNKEAEKVNAEEHLMDDAFSVDDEPEKSEEKPSTTLITETVDTKDENPPKEDVEEKKEEQQGFASLIKDTIQTENKEAPKEEAKEESGLFSGVMKNYF